MSIITTDHLSRSFICLVSIDLNYIQLNNFEKTIVNHNYIKDIYYNLEHTNGVE